MKKMDFEDGKYTLVLGEDGYTVTALRHGEPWRDFVGDSFISYLSQAVFEKAQAPTDECECKRSAKKVSMSGRHVNKTADSLHAPTDDEREILARIIHYETGEPEEESGFVADAILAAGFRRPAQTERSPEFDSLEQELFKHQPVLSMREGSIAGCQCLDRVFHKDTEDWGTHLAEVFESLRPAQVEPTEAQVIAAMRALHEIGDDLIVSERAMRAALKAAFSAGQEEQS